MPRRLCAAVDHPKAARTRLFADKLGYLLLIFSK